MIITSDLSSQSTELPPGIVLKEPLFFVIGKTKIINTIIVGIPQFWGPYPKNGVGYPNIGVSYPKIGVDYPKIGVYQKHKH